MRWIFVVMAMLVSTGAAWAAPGIPAFTVVDDGNGGQQVSVTLQVLGIMTLLTFLPAIIMMMTSFTRIVIVLSILRQAMGLQQTPSSQIIIGLSLFLTFFIMTPVFMEVNTTAIQPYIAEEISPIQALERAKIPFQVFMLQHTRLNDLDLFARLAGYENLNSPEDAPFLVLVPAFVTSELKTAFQIGFLIFIPFLVIDMVVASILMTMGMMMLSPLIISLPFKIMLFVLVDGWVLIIGSLARSFGLGP
jgi:flagellar biosynthetic protein FliP